MRKKTRSKRKNQRSQKGTIEIESQKEKRSQNQER